MHKSVSIKYKLTLSLLSQTCPLISTIRTNKTTMKTSSFTVLLEILRGVSYQKWPQCNRHVHLAYADHYKRATIHYELLPAHPPFVYFLSQTKTAVL